MIPGSTETREAQAAREAGTTAVSRGVAATTAALFLLVVVGVSAIETARDLRADSGSPWEELARAPRAVKAAADSGVLAANRALLGAMTAFEDALEDGSVVTARAGSLFQGALTGLLGAGNEQVAVGRDGWLYFRLAVDYVTGPGFLGDGDGVPEPTSVARGVDERVSLVRAHEQRSHPVAALADFAAQLAERGIGLVVVPTPVKASLHPEGLARTLARADLPIENPAFHAFVERLAMLDIAAYVPGERLARRASVAEPRFLRTDSHWTPPAVAEAAAGLAEFLARHPLPERRPVVYTRRPTAVMGSGDLVALLRPNGGRPLFRPEGVIVDRVLTPTGEPWAPDPAADVLLLGDSYSNVYSQPELGWGDAAGFGAQLSFFLRRPVDQVAVNAGGPTAARERLAALMAAGDDRLAGKRLVVYQFSVRELPRNGWRLVNLTPGRPSMAAAPARGRARRPEEPLPARGFAVWESNRTGSWRIWARRLEGSASRQLMPDEPGAQHCCAHLSPDGTRLVYLSRRYGGDQYPPDDLAGELRLVRLDGGGDRVVAPAAFTYGAGNRAALWRSDRELIYVGADARTYLYDLGARTSTPLTRGPRGRFGVLIDATLRYATIGWPTFAPYDAARKEVARAPRRPGCEPYFTHDGRFGYWVAGGGGPIRRIDLASGAVGTMIEKDDPRLPGAQRYVYFPMVSRDGRLLAYGASGGDHDHYRSNYDVFVAPVDPSSLELVGRPARLTAHPSSDRYPDVHVESLDVERWRREAPPVAASGGPPTPPPAPGPLEADAVLRACSRAYGLREISPYRSALVACEWEVARVLAGQPPGLRVRVVHWSLRDGERQPIVGADPGFSTRLRLEPFVGVAQIEGFPVSNTLPPAPDKPLYYAR